MSLTNATTAATNFAKKNKTKKVQKSGKKQSELKLVFLAFWSTKNGCSDGGENLSGDVVGTKNLDEYISW